MAVDEKSVDPKKKSRDQQAISMHPLGTITEGHCKLEVNSFELVFRTSNLNVSQRICTGKDGCTQQLQVQNFNHVAHLKRDRSSRLVCHMFAKALSINVNKKLIKTVVRAFCCDGEIDLDLSIITGGHGGVQGFFNEPYCLHKVLYE